MENETKNADMPTGKDSQDSEEKAAPQRHETLEQRSERERNDALAKRDVAYISGGMDDFWGFGG